MNNRIKEPYYSLMYKASEGWNDHLWQVLPEVLQKYSESIVMECAKFTDPGMKPFLFKHFGIEE
jgi:hypothetical protein